MGRAALTDPTTPLNVQPVGQTGWGDPVFSDEFNAPVDWGKWDPWYPDTGVNLSGSPAGHLSNSHGEGRDEPQVYDPSAVTVTDGSVVFTMRAEVLYPDTLPQFPYVSGMLSSYPSFSTIGGFVEARMRLADVDGAWPAFWLLSSQSPLRWPPEIDVMENWGNSSNNNVATHGVFYDDQDHTNGFANVVASDWNTYGAHIRPGEGVTFYLNGTQVGTIDDPRTTTEPMYLILNLAGDYGANTPDPADLPFSIQTDYVRAWSTGGQDATDTASCYTADGTPLRVLDARDNDTTVTIGK